jgi:hypothetical protein
MSPMENEWLQDLLSLSMKAGSTMSHGNGKILHCENPTVVAVIGRKLSRTTLRDVADTAILLGCMKIPL